MSLSHRQTQMKQRWTTIKIAYPSIRLTTYYRRALAGLCTGCNVPVTEYRKCGVCRREYNLRYGAK